MRHQREPSSALQKFLGHFAGHVKNRKGGTAWTVRCPGHNDTNPSLDIDVGDDGRILLACRSGNCPAEKIVAAMPGFAMRDLLVPDGKLSFGDRMHAIYDYRDEDGSVSFQVVRLVAPKDFLQRRPAKPGEDSRVGLEGRRGPPRPLPIPTDSPSCSRPRPGPPSTSPRREGRRRLVTPRADGLAKRVEFDLRPGWTPPPNLYAVVVMVPSERKSAVFSACIAKPIGRLEQEAIEAAKPIIAERECELAL